MDKLKITSFDDGLLIYISGELDSQKSYTYRIKIRDSMIKYAPRYILFDFKDLTFIDSSGIGLILGRYNEVSKNRGVLGLINLSSYTRKILSISGIFQVIEEFESLNDFKKKVGIYG